MQFHIFALPMNCLGYKRILFIALIGMALLLSACSPRGELTRRWQGAEVVADGIYNRLQSGTAYFTFEFVVAPSRSHLPQLVSSQLNKTSKPADGSSSFTESLGQCFQQDLAGNEKPTFLEWLLNLIIPKVYARGPFSDETQCVAYVSTRRPDSLLWLEYGADAHYWDDMARRNGEAYGVYVDDLPQVGDVAVWEADCDGRNATAGHVAYVTDVLQGGSLIVVDERNADSQGSISLGQEYPVVNCMSFIHTPEILAAGSTEYEGFAGEIIEEVTDNFWDALGKWLQDLWYSLFGGL